MPLGACSLHKKTGVRTYVYVTDGPIEAMTLADRVVILNAGLNKKQSAPPA